MAQANETVIDTPVDETRVVPQRVKEHEETASPAIDASKSPETEPFVVNFDDDELLEIDEEEEGGEGEQDEPVRDLHIEEEIESNEPEMEALGMSAFTPTPIIIQTNNFPYLLAPIPHELLSSLPPEYEGLVTLLDEAPMPGSTLYEVIDSIKQKFKELENPFDEKDELLVYFKEFDITLVDTCVHAHEVLLSEVYEAFEALKRFKGSDAPHCLTLLLKPQRAFVTLLDELRTVNGDHVDPGDDTLVRQLDEEAKRDSVMLTAEDLKDLDESLESDNGNSEEKTTEEVPSAHEVLETIEINPEPIIITEEPHLSIENDTEQKTSIDESTLQQDTTDTGNALEIDQTETYTETQPSAPVIGSNNSDNSLIGEVEKGGQDDEDHDSKRSDHLTPTENDEGEKSASAEAENLQSDMAKVADEQLKDSLINEEHTNIPGKHPYDEDEEDTMEEPVTKKQKEQSILSNV